MSKEKKVFNVDITINPDAIRAAAVNAAKVQDVALEVPIVDARDLSIDDQIFGIELLPIAKEVGQAITPDSTKYVAIKPVIVDVLSGRAKPGFITVNGTIDLPKEQTKVVKLEDAYFANEVDARAVCRIMTEVELDRSLKKQETERLNSDFLQKQLDKDRF
jgi:hypothetical protein